MEAKGCCSYLPSIGAVTFWLQYPECLCRGDSITPPSLPISVVPRGLSQPTSTFEGLALARPRRASSGTWLELLGKSYSLFTSYQAGSPMLLGGISAIDMQRMKSTWRKQSQQMQRGWLLLTPFEPVDATMPQDFLVINANKFTFLFKSTCAEL